MPRTLTKHAIGVANTQPRRRNVREGCAIMYFPNNRLSAFGRRRLAEKNASDGASARGPIADCCSMSPTWPDHTGSRSRGVGLRATNVGCHPLDKPRRLHGSQNLRCKGFFHAAGAPKHRSLVLKRRGYTWPAGPQLIRANGAAEMPNTRGVLAPVR